MKIKSFVAIDYSGVIEAIKSDKLETAFLGPNAYVLAKGVHLSRDDSTRRSDLPFGTESGGE